MGIETGIFKRTELLVGNTAFKQICDARVIIFGVGGVGSWCAESLVRSGIKYLTIVDSDRVCITNINRQLMATTETGGQIKVEALKKRLLSINPTAEINALQQIYCAETANSFQIETYDYIIDAIDTVSAKIELIVRAQAAGVKIISSMGAGNKLDPTRFEVADIYKTSVCPLARVMRTELKKRGVWIYTADMDGKNWCEVDYSGGVGLVIGSAIAAGVLLALFGA